MTPEELERQRQRRRDNGNAITIKYERTKRGKLMRIYRNMKSRVEGVQKKKHHLYEGKELIEKEAFYKWAENNPNFLDLYEAWVDSGYARKMAPSVDRLDPRKGYTTDNMEWVTHSENSRRGGLAKKPRVTITPDMVACNTAEQRG